MFIILDQGWARLQEDKFKKHVYEFLTFAARKELHTARCSRWQSKLRVTRRQFLFHSVSGYVHFFSLTFISFFHIVWLRRTSRR